MDPFSMLEDELVKMDDLIFSTNFVILDMDEDAKFTPILKRHFFGNIISFV